MDDSTQIQRPIPNLSPREQQLLQFAAEGFTDTAIAHKLGISEATVGTYWGRVRIKLGPYSRTELVAIILRAEGESALEALRHENEELVAELHDKSRSGEAGFYRDLVDNAPDAILVVSAGGKIDYANLEACEMFGYLQEEFVGLHHEKLVPARFQEKHAEAWRAYFLDSERRTMGAHLETPALRKDGTEFLIRASLSALEGKSGPIVTCVIRAANV